MLSIDNVGKRYKYEWIFRKVSYNFEPGNAYAITGSNGSGKSTFLKLLSGIISPSEGSLFYTDLNLRKHEQTALNQHIAIVAPYMELINELTLNEFINFHCKVLGLDSKQKEQINSSLPFKKGVFNRKLSDFSSGMQQRVKLITAIKSSRDIILLDEPTMNLDTKGIDWYLEIINNCSSPIKIVCSNQKHEYGFCSNVLNIEDFHYSKKSIKN